jgi:pyridoxine 4-dehydrogenase
LYKGFLSVRAGDPGGQGVEVGEEFGRAVDVDAYVPFFPLGGFSPLQSSALSAVAERLGSTPMSVALAWLLRRSPNILLIPGTSSVAHLRENITGAGLTLADEDLAELDKIGR